MNRDNKRRGPRPERREEKEFDQTIVDIARVTRVMAGGKRMRFRACVVIGDKKGRVGMGIAKGADVTIAVEKAVRKAKNNLIKIDVDRISIPHAIELKDGSARILLKPAPAGTGIISGGAIRVVLELAGIKNIVSKILGANNKVNNVRAAIKALSLLKSKKQPVKAKVEIPVETVKTEVIKD